ncbi:protein FAM160A1-like [Thalassophryne amazonica]|uniref:protein FAM160A1-like n=1 Tax=Thalassophryne amazonica TaxID=390379 RepID=UPI001472245E|nr:protein FAM160A1-like [Thalassophryne amazonica]
MMASVITGVNRKKSLTLRGVDPETCMIVFKNHWAQVVNILQKHEPGQSCTSALSFLSGNANSGSGGCGGMRFGAIPADEASAVQNYVEHMLFLLMEEEAGQGGAMGPILEFVILESVMERLFLWSLRRQFTEDMKLEQLRMYQMLISQARQPLLHHKPVLRPLMMLLASCTGTDSDGVVEAELVFLLNQLCVVLVKDPSVLELFFHTSEDQGAANFLLFSLLIPYTHRQGSVGRLARDALLLIMSLSASEPRVAHHIAENTYFCPVLATGLSGLYSSLPARLQVYSEDWHCLDQADWQQVPALVHFLHSLDFCSAVTKVAHPSIRSQLLGYIYNGFLVPVMAPALHKVTVEEVMTTTAYLDLFLRSVSEPALLQTFLSFILLHTHDNVHILDALVSRVNTPFQLGTVSLALFRTLIGLFCEDVMLQLVLRYLIPCSHLSKKQRSSLKKRDCYSSSAEAFLLLLPAWYPVHLPNNSLHSNSEHIHWPKRTDSIGYCRGSDFLMDVNYLHYLWDARQAIATSRRCCQHWSALYDGTDPLLQEYRTDTPGGDEDVDDDSMHQIKSDSIYSLVTTPTPSSSDTFSTGNQAARSGSALELEWDDIFADDNPCLSEEINTVPTNGNMTVSVNGCPRNSSPAPPPIPPQHIQEMRRTATKLVQGSYVEDCDFQDDALAYDLVAQKETKGATTDEITDTNWRVNRNISNGHHVSTTVTKTLATMLTTTGRTVLQTVNSIMSTRRRSEDGGKEERRWTEDYGNKERRRSEDCGKQTGRRRNNTENDKNSIESSHIPNNGCFAKNRINECVYAEEDDKQNDDLSDFTPYNHPTHTSHQPHTENNSQHRAPCLVTNTLLNGHSECESHNLPACATDAESQLDNNVTKSNGFLSQYHELMAALGVESNCDDTEDMSAFKRRVQVLWQRLEDEEEGLIEDAVFSYTWEDEEKESEEEVMEERKEENEEEERRSIKMHGVPFTGPFISVLLSRLENLLENSIAVNLLVTGILAQLASYPQPLLKSFLLSTQTRDRSYMRTLYQVLVSVHNQIERYLSDKPDYPALVTEAWRFLLVKDQDSKISEYLQSQNGDMMGMPFPNGSVRGVAPPPPPGVLPPCPHIPAQAKSRVFAIILYAEFLKEVAAIAQEHSVDPDNMMEV